MHLQQEVELQDSLRVTKTSSIFLLVGQGIAFAEICTHPVELFKPSVAL